jgi:hypothetical protein
MLVKKLVLGAVMVSGMALAYAAGAANKKEAMIDASAIQWQDYAPGVPLKVAVLWGDRAKGEYGMLLKMPAGFEAGMHAHTGDYYGINVQGTWVHTFEGGESKELAVGSYVMQPGKAFHNDSCKGTQDCILFIHQHKKGDFIPKPAPKEVKETKAPTDAKQQNK